MSVLTRAEVERSRRSCHAYIDNPLAKIMKVDDDIMKNGEGAAQKAENEATGEEKKLGEDFLAQMRMGKSFLHGMDKEGRPLCFVRVRLHRQGEQSEQAVERYTVYTIETARFLLRPPVDTAVSFSSPTPPPINFVLTLLAWKKRL